MSPSFGDELFELTAFDAAVGDHFGGIVPTDCTAAKKTGILGGMTTKQPKPRRRWLQFSLRTMFVVVTVFCVWMGFTAKRARDQREAVEAIEALGGTVDYEHEVFEVVNQLYVLGRPPGPEWLRKLVGDEYFVSVNRVALPASKLDDAMISRFERLTNLRYLNLIDTPISDESIEKLQQALPNSEWIIYIGKNGTLYGSHYGTQGISIDSHRQ